MLPDWYKKWIPRVSEIVSFVFPFSGEGKQRYLDWLADNVPPKRKRGYAIDEDEYLEEAQTVGTYVHLLMENHILWKNLIIGNPLYEKHKEVISHWLEYIDQLKKKYTKKDWWKILTEPVVRDQDNRWQWSVDVVLINEGARKVIIKDWKTFWIAKARYGLPNTYRKPYDKLKKGALQFSLYAETYRQKGYSIESIDLIYLHETGAYEYSLDLYPSEKLNTILERYILKDTAMPPDTLLLFNYTPSMTIEIQSTIPDLPYSKAGIMLDTNDVEKFKNPQEAIESAITLQKYLLNKYK